MKPHQSQAAYAGISMTTVETAGANEARGDQNQEGYFQRRWININSRGGKRRRDAFICFKWPIIELCGASRRRRLNKPLLKDGGKWQVFGSPTSALKTASGRGPEKKTPSRCRVLNPDGRREAEADPVRTAERRRRRRLTCCQLRASEKTKAK